MDGCPRQNPAYGLLRRPPLARGSLRFRARRVIQAALNGDRPPGAHPAVPVSAREIAADAAACRAAGAASVHFHPRGPDGAESLDARGCDAAVAAVRAAAPGLEISLSTAAGIDLGGARDRIAAVRAWGTPPDLVSVNLSEDGSLALGVAVLEHGIGIEAGVFTLDDADRLLSAPWAGRVRRILVETFLDDPEAAVADARAIDARVAPLGRPRLWHGVGRATWAVVAAGLAAGHDVRVGLEDALDGDGGPAPGNPGQVAAAHALAR